MKLLGYEYEWVCYFRECFGWILGVVLRSCCMMSPINARDRPQIIIQVFKEQKIKTAISRPSNKIQQESVIEPINDDMGKSCGCTDWSLRINFPRSNRIFFWRTKRVNRKPKRVFPVMSR